MLTPTDRQKGEGSNKREKKVSTGLKVRSPPRKALFSLLRLFGLFDPTGPSVDLRKEQQSPPSAFLSTPRYPQLPLKNGMKLKMQVFKQPLKETVLPATGKQGSTHTENTLGHPQRPPQHKDLQEQAAA